MAEENVKTGFLTPTQHRLVAAAFLALTAGGLALWLAKGDSVYLNMLMTGLANCF